MGAYLANPFQTAAFLALVGAGFACPESLAVAAAFFCAAEVVAGIRGSPGPRWLPGAWPREAVPLTVLYDGTCRLCAGSKARLERWRTASALRFLTLQSEEARGLLPGMKPEEYLGAMHAVEGGKVYSAHEAWFRIMRLAPLRVAWLAWITPRFAARPFYAWVARNRIRWFGRTSCAEGGCSAHPGDQGLRR